MTDLRTAAQQALEALVAAYQGKDKTGQVTEAITALKAALTQGQAEREQLIEKVRVRIMQTALDCADDNEIESYNGVKVMCSDVLEMLK